VARDVEFNYTATDKTGEAAASAERRMKRTAESIKKDSDKLSTNFAASVVKMAEGVSPKLAAGLVRGFESAASAAPPILAAGVAAAAPFAAAVLSSAIIGGVGAGGIIGGVALAARDPRVKAEFAAMKTRVGAELADAAQPFVDVTIAGIDQIEGALDTIDFDRIFAQSAKNAGPVLAGIARGIEGVGNGIERVIEKSGPVMEQLGDSIGDLGEHVGQFLNDIAEGSEGAAAGLRDFVDIANTVLDNVGPMISGLTQIYGWLSQIGVTGPFLAGLAGPLGTIAYALRDVGDGAERTSGQVRIATVDLSDAAAAAAAGTTQFDQYGRAVLSSGAAIDTFTAKMHNLAATGQSVFDATTRVGQAIAAVTAAAKKNGQTLDENTEKGRANREALSVLAGALLAQYDATVKVNGEGAEANAVAAQNREQFVRLATSMTGSKRAAEQLATSLGLIPAKKDVKVNANTHDAEGRLRALQDKINGLKGKTVTITIARKVTGSKASDSALGAAIDKNFDASDSFRFAGSSPGGRSEPARMPLSERVDNYLTVTLDGSVIYATTERMLTERSKRDAWRQRAGRR
jgi:hypothetical protein